MRGERSFVWIIVALALAALVAAGPFLSASWLSRANLAMIAVIAAAALNVLTGNAGQVSLGHAAFLATGAYMAVVVNLAVGGNLLVAIPVGAATAALLGLLIGLPSLRFRGFYLALTTLALHYIVVFAANRFQVAFGGLAGFRLPAPSLGPLTLGSDLRWYYLLLASAALVLAILHNLTQSKIGRAWKAVRDRDIAASIIGIDVSRYKLIAFTVSSLFTGFAGVLQAYYLGNVAVESYSLDLAISFVAMIIIGGMASIAGSILGAIAVTQLPFAVQAVSGMVLPEGAATFSIFDVQAGAFGLIIIVFLLLEPDGLAGLVSRAWKSLAGLSARAGAGR